jgi:alkylation response protein AidB-like acyl-CoA dehydrogenase
MRFAVAEDAAALRDAAEALLAARATPALIRSAWPGAADPARGGPSGKGGLDGEGGKGGPDGKGGLGGLNGLSAVRGVWRGLADIGVTGALVAEADGGLGLDENALPPVLSRIGRSGLPVPAGETIAVAAPLLAAAGHPALPDVLSGAALVTAQLATPAAAGLLVPFGQTADYVLLRADDGELRVYERGELEAAPVPAVDGSRQLARLLAKPAGGAPVAAPADAAAGWERGAPADATAGWERGAPADAAAGWERGVPADAAASWERGVLAAAAILVGLAERMLSMTVDYVAVRRQFGVPVGSFQAVKHRLADAYLAVEFARPAVLAAGWAQASGAADAAEQTSVAKVLASDAATTVARAAIQCHGAIGYTTEYDLHLFAKRAWALAPSWGSANWHRRRLAASLCLTKDVCLTKDGSEPDG